MIEYSTLRGRAFKVNAEYPIYDEDDNVIGHTSPDDIIVVTLDLLPSNIQSRMIGTGDRIQDYKVVECEMGDYLECTVATGDFAGYSGLALNADDIQKAVYIGDNDEVMVRAHGLRIR